MKPAALLLLGTLAFAVQAAEPAALKLTQTIPLPGVKGRFDHFAIDTTGKRLFVAALGNNTLEVVGLAAGKRIRSVSGKSKPTGILYLPDQNQLIVANGDDGTLKILSGTDYKVLQNLTALADADNLRFDPQTKLAWLGYGEGALAIIDTAAAKVLGSVKLPAHPESFQLERSNRRIFVNVPDAKQVAVIDRVKRTVTHTWPFDLAAMEAMVQLNSNLPFMASLIPKLQASPICQELEHSALSAPCEDSSSGTRTDELCRSR